MKKNIKSISATFMPGMRVTSFTTVGLFSILCGTGTGYCQDTPPTTQADIIQMRQQLESQAKKLAEHQRLLSEELKKLDAQKGEFEATQRQLDALEERMGIKKPAPKPQQVAKAQPQQQAQAAPPAQPVGQAPEKPKDSRPPEVAPIFEQPGVLTPRGSIVLEPSIQYSYSSSDHVSIVGYTIIPALTIGLIDVRSVSTSTLIGALTARYGVTNRLEIEAKVPYVYRTQDTVSRPFNDPAANDSLFNADGKDLGDVEFAARYQVNVPQGSEPYYVAGLRFKTRTGKDPFEVPYVPGNSAATPTFQTTLPTGSGFYSLQPSLSVIYPTDPAVFFGGINYLYNFNRDVNKKLSGTDNFIGTVEPGDAVGINFGMGLSLNEKSAFSLGYEHTWIGKTKQNGTEGIAVSSEVANLLMGFSYRLSDKESLNVSVAAGLTPDAPNAQVTVRLPYSF